jgi:hypothetical protein
MEVAGSTPNVFARHLAVKLKGEDFLRNHAIEPRFINLNLKTKGRL